MKTYSSYDDESLMSEIRAGNIFAFDEIYRKYSKHLYKFSFSIIKSHEEAENIIQDVFLNLWLNRNRIEKCASLKYYILTMTYNSAIAVIRKRAKEADYVEYVKSLQNPQYEEEEDLKYEYDELEKKLDQIVKILPERQREIYRLHKIEGLKYSEIAQKLNISTNTIETHMSRALKTIKEKLGRYSVIIITLFYYLKS